MAQDDYFAFNGTEFINKARTYYLTAAAGPAGVLRFNVKDIEALRATFPAAPADYADVVDAPWYDPYDLASTEFRGVVPVAMRGLDDASGQASVREYTGDGGSIGTARSGTLPIVAEVVLVALTERGAEFGLRWMSQVLSQSGTFCQGAEMTYLAYRGTGPLPIVHRRDVRLTRAPVVTLKRRRSCYTVWTVTFTLTCGDPFEYGQKVDKVETLGAPLPVGQVITSKGTVNLVEAGCPVYDYTPIYDPLYPALIPSPTAPDFLPNGWGIAEGQSFKRYWVRTDMTGLTGARGYVPIIKVSSNVEARRLRVSLWPASSAPTDNCGWLFSVVLNYIPAQQDFYVDAEQGACYLQNENAEFARRADSLAFSPDASPVVYPRIEAENGMLMTLDTFSLTGGTFEGGGNIRTRVSLVPKSY